MSRAKRTGYFAISELENALNRYNPNFQRTYMIMFFAQRQSRYNKKLRSDMGAYDSGKGAWASAHCAHCLIRPCMDGMIQCYEVITQMIIIVGDRYSILTSLSQSSSIRNSSDNSLSPSTTSGCAS